MPDNLLESLEYIDGEWEGEIEFPILGKEILLVIDANELNGPSSNQQEKLNWMHDNIATLMVSVEESLYQYYQDQLKNYTKKLGKKIHTLMPKIKSPQEVWQYVFEPGIYIAPDEDNEIHLEYECSFDEENGLRVIIKDGEISKVSL